MLPPRPNAVSVVVVVICAPCSIVSDCAKMSISPASPPADDCEEIRAPSPVRVTVGRAPPGRPAMKMSPATPTVRVLVLIAAVRLGAEVLRVRDSTRKLMSPAGPLPSQPLSHGIESAWIVLSTTERSIASMNIDPPSPGPLVLVEMSAPLRSSIVSTASPVKPKISIRPNVPRFWKPANASDDIVLLSTTR